MNKYITAALILSAATPCAATADGKGDLPYTLDNKYITSTEARSPLTPPKNNKTTGRHTAQMREPGVCYAEGKSSRQLEFHRAEGKHMWQPGPDGGVRHPHRNRQTNHHLSI
ncbi:MAG: hypothetical protein IJ993_06715 [Akkermansia sp.]|nr:hypothetical protein [Akkermansia sp.]